MKYLKYFLSLFLMLAMLFISGCGYHFGGGSTLASFHSISVPYVEGDWDGSITTAIVKEISEFTNLKYLNKGGSLTLKVKILDYEDEEIGFRYDRKKDGRPRNAIIPDETRTTIWAEVILVELCSGKNILGPVYLFAEVEYDHDYYTNRDAINVFSLGQVSDVEEAYDAAQAPLNKRLAEKIVSFLKNSW